MQTGALTEVAGPAQHGVEEPAGADSRRRIGGPPALLRRVARSPFFPIWPATALLFAVSPLIDPGSLRSSALVSTLPFAALLAIASFGQTLVIQQRGLDLSVPGMISLGAILITKYPNQSNSGLLGGIGLVVLACVLSGLVSGFCVTRLRITPLVATLGVNALLLGTIIEISNGTSTTAPPPALVGFAFGKTAGIPNTVYVAGGVAIVLAFLVRRTVAGRRFVAVGTNAPAAYVAGIGVDGYVWATYVVASLFYGLAAVLVAGYVGTPGLSAGNNYLLPSITAVVLGGASLAGGSGSLIGTAIGALFLTQLQQDVFGAGAPTSVQYLIQAGVIALAMALRQVHWRAAGASLARRSARLRRAVAPRPSVSHTPS